MTEKEPLDPTINAFRPDLADASLRAYVQAESYVEPALRQCVRGIIPLLQAPDPDAPRISEIRYGEFLDVFEERKDGFAWVQNRNDRMVGYIQKDGVLSESIAALMNRINVLHTFVHAKPDPRSPILDRLTLGSYVSLAGEEGEFYPLASGGYVFKGHVVPTDEVFCADFVFTAGQLLGRPFLAGGRTPLGIDAEGLVQLALDLGGIDAPRTNAQLKALFGHPLPCHWRDIVWKRGDLVFFENAAHVGLMTSPDHIITADPLVRQVTVEPLENLTDRGYRIVAAGHP
ncbi:MAG: NlpC/P60 family protein [Bdellovibrionales bacterium]|jgi:cell wall-associated NlpC family hydrolase